MKQLLVTTDLSEESKAAFPHARALAEACGASIVLLAVIEDPAKNALSYAAEFPIHPEIDIRRQMRQRIEQELTTLASSYFSGLSIAPLVVETERSVADEIVDTAVRIRADMIVLSAQGHTGIARLILGSVAERVIRQAPCPVTVVPGPKK